MSKVRCLDGCGVNYRNSVTRRCDGLAYGCFEKNARVPGRHWNTANWPIRILHRLRVTSRTSTKNKNVRAPPVSESAASHYAVAQSLLNSVPQSKTALGTADTANVQTDQTSVSRSLEFVRARARLYR